MRRIARLIGEACDCQLGLVPLTIFKDVNCTAVLATRRAEPRSRMSSEMHFGEGYQLNHRGIECDNHCLCPGICWRVRLHKSLVDLLDTTQRLEYPFCAPMASTSKSELFHIHLPRTSAISDASLPNWPSGMNRMNRASTRSATSASR